VDVGFFFFSLSEQRLPDGESPTADFDIGDDDKRKKVECIDVE
jgi:hypothetical protein